MKSLPQSTRPAIRLTLALPIALVLCSVPLAAQEPDTALLDRVQAECLRAYTPEMLAGLFGSEEIPAAALQGSEAAIDELIDVLNVEKGRFFPFLLEDLRDAFELWVKPGARFLDLGSGDGRVVFYAASLGANATGIEYDPEVFGASERARDALGDVLKEDVSINLIQDDFFNHSWSGYDVIFYFDLGSFEQNRLRKKIFSELDPGARLIVGHQRVRFPGLDLETTFDSLHVYRQPDLSEDYDPKLSQYAGQEILDAYALMESWSNGTLEKNDANLAPYADVLTHGFQILDPSGAVMNRSRALNVLRESHGRSKGEDGTLGQIRIENMALRFIVDSVVTYTFDEIHTVRGQTRKIKTTAVLQLRYGLPNNVQWLHVHQSDLNR